MIRTKINYVGDTDGTKRKKKMRQNTSHEE